MGCTVQFFICMFGLVLMNKTLQASTDNEPSIRGDRETRCKWQCAVILGRCLLEGKKESACKRIAKRCAWLCAIDRINARREEIGAKQCKQECYGEYQQCETIATTSKDQTLCIIARAGCLRRRCYL